MERRHPIRRRLGAATAGRPALREVSLAIPATADLRHHRAGQLRQDDAAEVHQSHARLHAGGAGQRRVTVDGRRRVRATATSASCAAAWAWSFPCRSACRFRSTRTWPMPRAAPACTTAASWTPWSRQCLRQAMLWDEVKRPARLAGHAALRRTTAAADAGPRPFAPAGNPLPRRVLHRHRSGDDDEDRGRAAGTEGTDDDRAGYEPRAAGPSAGRPHGVLQRRPAHRGGRDGDRSSTSRPTGSPSATSTETSANERRDAAPAPPLRHRRPAA